MTEVELGRFYEGEYRRLYQGEEGPGRKDLVIQAGRAESLLAFLGGEVERLSRVLDIGCSAGTFLARIRERTGAEVAGIEPGDSYRTYAQSQRLTVYPSIEALRKAGEAPFDLICMAHVLEHLPDPAGTLADLRENSLIPRGLLLVEVPNLYTHDSFEVAHLAAFSAHTLAQMLRKAGYEIVRLRARGQPRSVVLPLYLTALARPLAEPGGGDHYQPRPESAVGFKRRWGLARRRILERIFPDLAWLAVP
jgi:2-polyprenyl-3-methyl-5-hydroxy-6-metoxy-1,4-benzoquinol methylase